MFDTKYKIITPAAAAASHRASKDTSNNIATFYCVCKILQQSFTHPDYSVCERMETQDLMAGVQIEKLKLIKLMKAYHQQYTAYCFKGDLMS